MLRNLIALFRRGSAPQGSADPSPTRRSRTAAAALFLASFVTYVAHAPSWESADSVPTKLIPVLLLTKGTLHFDDYMPAFGKKYPGMKDQDFFYFVIATPNGYVSFFPIAPGLLMTPVLGPFILWKSREHPSPEQWIAFTDRAERVVAPLLTSACVVALFYVLLQIGATRGAATILSLVFAFGSNAFCTFSQQLWQHGFCTLLSLGGLLAALRLLGAPGVWRFLWVGLAFGLAVACRPTYLVLLCSVGAWLACKRHRAVPLFAVGAAVTIVPVIAYNLSACGNLFGGYYIHAAVPELPLSKAGVLAAMLFSPSKGLFFFFPVGLLSLVGFWMAVRKGAEHLLLYASLLTFSVGCTLMIWWIRWDGDWYGGHCFGPRYQSDFQFALVLLMAPILSPCVGTWLRAVLFALSLASVFMQAIGVYVVPGDANFHAARVWSLANSPLGRALKLPTTLPSSPASTPASPMPDVPIRTSAWNPVQEMDCDGEKVLFVHPPSEIALRAEGRTSVTGHFGLFPKAYEDGGQTDGVEFIIEIVKHDGSRTTLFHRLLQPLTQPADRGTQSFSIDLTGLSGDLILMTRCGPAYNEAWDWSYWGLVRFH